MRRGSVLERLRNTEQGVEQTWELNSKPQGQGDLVVRVRTRGLQYAGRTDAGQHFVDEKSGLGFRYGHATFVDAAGARTSVPVRWDGAHLVMKVSARVLDSASYPAVLDPVVSPEFGLDEPVVGPSIFSQSAPAVAANGSDYLVVWSDLRPPADGRDIYGARVAADGTLLDPLGISLSLEPGTQRAPAVAAAGDEWFVVWQDDRGSTDLDIFGTRVDSDGSVKDPEGLPIVTEDGDQDEPDVASDGTSYLVAWADGRNDATTGLDIYGSRVATDGTVLDPSGVALSNAPDVQRLPAVGSTGSGWLVAWTDARLSGTGDFDVHATRVSSTGAVLDPSGFSVSAETGHQAVPAIASEGTEYLVVWEDRRDSSSNGWDVYGARVSTDGAVIDPAGVPISDEQSSDQMLPTVAWDGTQYLTTWDDARNDCSAPCDVYAARVATDGTVVDTAGFPVVTFGGDQRMNDVASTGSGSLVVWADNRESETQPSDIYAARVASDGSVMEADGFPVSLQANVQSFGATASNGVDYLVVWSDFRNFTPDLLDVYGVRVSPDGTVLDPLGIPIGTGPGRQESPAVASDGTDFLVAWSDDVNEDVSGTDVRAARVRSDGTVAEESGFDVTSAGGAQARPAIASNGTTYLVAWQDDRVDGTDWDIFGARVASDGTVLDPTGIPVSSESFNQSGQSVASDGAGYFVAWHDARDGTQFDIFGSRLAADGTVEDPTGIPVSTAAENQFFPEATFNGSDYFLAWHDARNGGDGDYDVFGNFVSPAGTVVGAGDLPIAVVGGSHQASVDVASDPAGTSLVVWRDMRNGQFDLFANRVQPDGTILDESGFVVSAEPTEEGGPTVASHAAGTWLVAYNRQLIEGDEGVTVRMRARFVREEAACTTDADCDDGDPCNGSETCDLIADECQSGTPPTCDDGIACTTDGCDSEQGCTHTPDDSVCDDGDACNGAETCDPTEGCQSGAALDCDDGDACTVDSCDPTTGCQHDPVDCDDGDA
ncbi:MAG: hypothetical protein ACOCXM_00760, partial [Myxococcota bacterium]